MGGLFPGTEHTAFCTPLIPMPGKTVGDAATATMLGLWDINGLKCRFEHRSKGAVTTDRKHV